MKHVIIHTKYKQHYNELKVVLWLQSFLLAYIYFTEKDTLDLNIHFEAIVTTTFIITMAYFILFFYSKYKAENVIKIKVVGEEIPLNKEDVY